MSSYSEKFKDPRWQRKRLERFEAAGWECSACGATSTTLHLHHRYYVTGRDPWQYPNFCFVSLCSECHEDRHAPLEHEEDFSLAEWEVAADAFLGPNPEIGRFWDAAVSIIIAQNRGVTHRAILKRIVWAIESMESTESKNPPQ